jgi:hypothetical protein
MMLLYVSNDLNGFDDDEFTEKKKKIMVCSSLFMWNPCENLKKLSVWSGKLWKKEKIRVCVLW